MSDVALRMDGVHKRFRRGELYDSLRDLIPALTGRLFRRDAELRDRRDFWAVRDVSFTVAPGEALGIIGSNGAGKSTILKLLSGIMRPTLGRIEVYGRLSALIEVGAGFHPDLTGRENIYLNGTILGMSREDIRRRFDQIVAFSGLEEFIDTPVKRYSSGMFARLGFSVAAHVDPDILIVDEVLSVGDFVFQRRCIERMTQVLTSGTTVIFVSHNLRAVADLCDRALLLERGRVVSDDEPGTVIRTYLDHARAAAGDADSPVRVTAVRLRDERGEAVRFTAGQPAWLDVEITASQDTDRVAVVLELRDDSQYEVFNTSTERLGMSPVNLHAGETFRCSFALDLHLAAGTFHFAVLLYRYDIQREYHRRSPAVTFFVTTDRDVKGAVNLYPRITLPRT